MQLCYIDMKVCILNERIDVSVSFLGNLTADTLRALLTGPLDVGPEPASVSQL